MAAHRVRALLMGGQACVFYGAAEFSRDVDLAVLAEPDNLVHLQAALSELRAELVYLPPLTLDYLSRGHSVHFRCRHPQAENLRVDIMARLRGVADFEQIWERRTTVQDLEGHVYELLSLPDLVQAKKTQRDKDWPMLRRLVEADYAAAEADELHIRFWLRELRTPELLIEVANQWPALTDEVQRERALLLLATSGRQEKLAQALNQEERDERERDRRYWQPLKVELEALRRRRLSP